MLPLPPQDWIFVADESGVSLDRFTVVGGLCIHRTTLVAAYKTMAEFRRKFNMTAELKWTKITNAKEAEYRHLIEYFFSMNNQNYIHFHALIFDSHQWNHKAYNDGDGEVGLSKLFFQLALHKFVKIYGSKGALCIRLDRRNGKDSLHEFQRMLNRVAERDHGISGNPVKQVVPIDSKQCDLMQLNDVILGSVCAIRNGKHLLPMTRQAKRNLAELILEKSGLSDYDTNSPKNVNRFTIWNMRPRK